MLNRHIVFFILLGLLATPTASWGTKAYVTDSFRISLRRGPNTEMKILRFVSSGVPVKILETNEDGWSQVRLLDDEEENFEGWVLSRYLVRRLPWQEQYRLLKDENARLKKKLAQIDAEWTASIKEEREEANNLQQSYKETKQEIARLTAENDVLKSSKRKKWFTTGGLVMFSGLLVGLLVGKQPRKRRLIF